jgi:hypothetical protein
MFPPPIPIKRCPRCLARLDGRTAVCPNCKKKLLKKRGPVYLAQQVGLVLIITGIAALIAALYFLTLNDLLFLALLLGAPGFFLLLIGILVK